MRNSIILVSVPAGWPEDAPPRSAFFGLTPEGCGGASYEDLASYFRRLSAHHGLLPRSVAMRVVLPLLRDETTDYWMHEVNAFLMMNGVSQTAHAWVEALERLTLRNDLALRTMLPLRAVVPRFKLLSTVERFCPRCFRDDECVNRPKYNRLLWSIHCVEACPLHNVLLEVVPDSRKQVPGKFWLPGLSRVDATSLASHVVRCASEEQVQSAGLVAELLDDVHQYPDAFANGGAPGDFLQHAISTLFDGDAEKFADHVGIDMASLCNWRYYWRSKNIYPCLPRLLRLAYCCGCAISDVILGNKVMLKRVYQPSNNYRVMWLNHGTAKTSRDLLTRLNEVFESEPTLNLSQVAQVLEVSQSFLRRLAPDITALIVQRGKEARRRRKVQREEARFDQYYKSFQALCIIENVLPANDKVVRHLLQHNATTLSFVEARGFHKRARHLTESRCKTGEK
ncbi:hypothetical protein BZM27_51280 [Paraburkholderia steynii]|uniref:TniQ domain-containing protein n=1 Tax=Paraburkholderia steynii TaxID=1245441 RepID=A0A4R0XAY9_9BURK|nr:hypothetical protein BZM27_51280 [Paraburkholderia steynii]